MVALAILGWALDGHPIYGPYAYADPRNPTSAVKRMRSGYRLRSLTARTTLPDWSLPNHPGVSQSLTPAQHGPPIDAQFPLGRYNEDFEHVDGLGDLDSYNGRQEVTPEFPNGTYAYHVTIDDAGAPAFPYILGGEYHSAVVRGRRGGSIPATGLQEYFNSGSGKQAGGGETSPLLTSWLTNGSGQAAKVISGYDPSAGSSQTWPTNAPTGARYSGGTSEPAKADIQRVRWSDTAVYINANGLASYPMGPWFEATMGGGVFDNFPGVRRLEMQFPRSPASTTRAATGMGAVGLWVNGVSVFNFLDGATYSKASGTDAGGGRVVATAVNRSTASSENGPAAPGSLVSAHALFEAVLAPTTVTGPETDWPTTLGGTTVTIKDSLGSSQRATLHHVSPRRVDYRLPVSLAPGFATATIAHGTTSYVSNLNVVATYPNLFQADASGAAAAYKVSRNGENVRLLLQGTGLGGTKDVTASIGGVRVPVEVSAQGVGVGREQFSLSVPRTLAGKERLPVVITSAGRPSNAVYVNIK